MDSLLKLIKTSWDGSLIKLIVFDKSLFWIISQTFLYKKSKVSCPFKSSL